MTKIVKTYEKGFTLIELTIILLIFSFFILTAKFINFS